MSEKGRSPNLPTITFAQEDATGIIPGHDDPMVITIILANTNLHRTLVDQGSSADILFKSAFDKLGLQDKELRAYPNSLFGLGDTPIQPLGYISLHTTFGKGTRSRTLNIDYIIVNVSSAYNALIGRTTLNQLVAVVSTPHLCMKFPTPERNATTKGDQRLARRCYKKIGDAQEKTTNIGATLKGDLKGPLIQFLKDNADLFAWKATDMPDIDPKLMCHKLVIYPGSRPVQQKRRKLGPERSQVVEEQSIGRWRMCTDYTDLNKACPKDIYPLPNIDTLVDASFRYKYFSFMDAYSGYNQILMYLPDQEKTSFLTPKANYCYIVMPFGLKNTGATYQRLMNKVFADHIGKLMEVYVDDMLVKIKSEELLLSDLTKVFNTIRKHGMRHNPAKCTFAVEAGEFLGFMLTKRGIEANPDKFQAILHMKSLTCVKEVQQLNRRLAALSKFLAGSAIRSLPFYATLRKG
ncbi:uncharacterized protein LOC107492158 [Arachis duranensis]|uniref:Uncharacterized protein LOC107492158 n=1 Tax=Arachis duranensis TaxID=130453 RepID=A0A6P4DL78_ARADU|nr:uncharacterized protein LOC107492158 [Arachis duranensis]